MTTEEIVKLVTEKMIPEDFKMSYSKLKKSLTADEYDCKQIRGKQGYSIMYTPNHNFQQGIKNGGGRGWYIKLQFTGTIRTIKIENV